MDDALRIKLAGRLWPIPRFAWRRALASQAGSIARFVQSATTAQERRVRDYVVTTLAEVKEPLPPSAIAAGLGLSVDQVVDALNNLEKRRFFLVRNPEGAVTWAYPVTVEKTPHHLTFESGECAYAA